MVIYARPSEPEERLFNSRVGKGRMCVERAIGVLKRRWKILKHAIKGKMKNIEKTIIVCCCLHNFLIDEGMPIEEEEDVNVEVIESEEVISLYTAIEAVEARERLTKYMTS
jgi:hypothetical protein